MGMRLSLEAIVVRLGVRFFPAPGKGQARQRQSFHLSTTWAFTG